MACHSRYSALGSIGNTSYINLIFQQLWKGGIILSSFSQMKKLRCREVKSSAQGCTTRKEQVEFEARQSGSRVHMCNS